MVAIKHRGGEFILSPSADIILRPGDVLILVASTACLQELQRT